MVGGIAGAVGANNLGVRGVASAATLKGFNFLASNAQGNSNSNIEYSWWDGAEVADVGVFNNSWGSSPGNPNLPLAYSQNDIAAYERWSLRPLLSWSKRDVYYYMEEHKLPQHPLFEQGYSTVGDWHSSAPDLGDVSGRATRFGGLQQECGIHLPGLMGEGI